MLNRYSLWKYYILIILIIISCLYALPNLYGENPSIQITGIKGNLVNEKTLKKINNILKKENIEKYLIDITLDKGIILVRFNNPDIQMYAREILINNLNKSYLVSLSLAPATPYLLKYIGAKPIKLGLDLRGGVYFLIEVNTINMLNTLKNQYMENFHNDLHQHNIPYLTMHKTYNDNIEILFKKKYILSHAKSFLTKNYNDLIFNKNNNKLVISITDAIIDRIKNDILSQNIKIIRNRVNQLGLSESLVQRQGNNHIVVELPGIQDTAQAKEILGTTATLEFHLVNTTVDINNNNYIPNDSEIKHTKDGQSIVIYKKAILTGNHITNASSNFDEIGNPQVNIDLDNVGGSIMSNFTNKNQGEIIATLFIEYQDSGYKDNQGNSILIKKEEIINVAKILAHFNKKFRITGIKNISEAHQLALLLKAGTLISPINIVKERTIGPTLGFKNIKQGIKASLAALIISILFMIIYYRVFGLIASLALLFNLILIISIMSLLPGVTLTMPGIASIVLTLTVAIDANVLINERIKEELKNSNSIQKAIHKGYKKAFSSILDANITTVIIAIILYIFGTGSIKGFAIITIIGIITSMFTAIIGTRALVNLFYGNKRIKNLSI